jgi:hypothetical protein
VITRQGGGVQTVKDPQGGLTVGVQGPVCMYLGAYVKRATITSEAPLTYVGEANCPSWFRLTSFEPFTMIKE